MTDFSLLTAELSPLLRISQKMTYSLQTFASVILIKYT